MGVASSWGITQICSAESPRGFQEEWAHSSTCSLKHPVSPFCPLLSHFPVILSVLPGITSPVNLFHWNCYLRINLLVRKPKVTPTQHLSKAYRLAFRRGSKLEDWSVFHIYDTIVFRFEASKTALDWHSPRRMIFGIWEWKRKEKGREGKGHSTSTKAACSGQQRRQFGPHFML